MGLLMFWKGTFQHSNVEENQLILTLKRLFIFLLKSISSVFFFFLFFFFSCFLFLFVLPFLCTCRNTCTKSGYNSITRTTKSSPPKLGYVRLGGAIRNLFECLCMCTMIQSINISLNPTAYLGYLPVYWQKSLAYGAVKYFSGNLH